MGMEDRGIVRSEEEKEERKRGERADDPVLIPIDKNVERHEMMGVQEHKEIGG